VRSSFLNSSLVKGAKKGLPNRPKLVLLLQVDKKGTGKAKLRGRGGSGLLRGVQRQKSLRALLSSGRREKTKNKSICRRRIAQQRGGVLPSRGIKNRDAGNRFQRRGGGKKKKRTSLRDAQNPLPTRRENETSRDDTKETRIAEPKTYPLEQKCKTGSGIVRKNPQRGGTDRVP